MLKGIPEIISPALLKVLDEMGHGDRIVISDGNFPAESVGKDAIVIRADGHGVPEMLDAVLRLMPLDIYVEKPVKLMAVVPGDRTETPRSYSLLTAARKSLPLHAIRPKASLSRRSTSGISSSVIG